MQHDTHQTLVTIVQSHINDWRKSSNWSRETTAMTIIEAHERFGYDKISSIVFDPPTRDTFERARVNADRIFRWLDDHTKDSNLLPLNFLPSVLSALPADRRVALLNDLFRKCGVLVIAAVQDSPALDAVGMLRSLLAETSDATKAVAELVDGATTAELVAAQKELTEALVSTQAALNSVTSALARKQ
jgi:hypothetical protein